MMAVILFLNGIKVVASWQKANKRGSKGQKPGEKKE